MRQLQHRPSYGRRPALPLLALLLLAAAPAAGQDCPRQGNGWVACATPWSPPPETLWGELAPSDTALSVRGSARRDSTEFQDFDGPESTVPWFMSVDIENGYLFLGGGYKLQIWSAGVPADPAAPLAPALLGKIEGSGSGLGTFPFLHQDEISTPLRDLDAPEGVDGAVAIVGVAGMGISIVNTVDKTSPMLLYQHSMRDIEEVYAARINNSDYAFAAQTTGDTAPSGSGLYVYDMSQALRGSRCHAPLQSCPGVQRGRIGSRPASYVDGTGLFVVASAGTGRGYEIWRVSDPGTPATAELKLAGLSGQPVYGVALWEEEGKHYLALATSVVRDYLGQIYDVSCIATSCPSAPPLLASFPVRQGAPGIWVTFSRDGGRELLHFGTNDMSGQRTYDREFLVDVSTPAAPRTVSPPGYFSWTHNYNGVWPGRAKAYAGHLYRAGHTIFDTHRIVPQEPPAADFAWPATVIYPGMPVQFEDRSTNQPTTWNWTVEDGSPP